MHASRPTLLATLSVTLVVASLGFAQNALDPRPRDGRPARGQGNALDRNLGVGSGGINAANRGADFASRNLIVTDSVAGGRGFRGSVGYTAPTDFRGVTGSDSTFRFRADSALSSPTFIGSTRPGDRFELGQEFGFFEYRRESTPIDTRFAAPGDIDRPLRLDRAASTMTTRRLLESAAEPQSFATAIDFADRPIEFGASAVLGIRKRLIEDPLAAAELSTYERARARQDVAAGHLEPRKAVTLFGSPFSAESLRADTRLGGTRLGDNQATQSAYDQVVKRLLERYADDPNVRIDADPRAIERAQRELDALRQALTGRVPEAATPTPPEGRSEPLPGGEDPDRIPPKPAAEPETGDESPEAKARRVQESLRQSVDAAARSLRHGTRVGELTPGERARVDELVRDGQRHLERGDFLRAERSFDQALSLNPDNPLLIAGLANSQLGAGLYLSASLTLRGLFAEHPEMIDVQYEARLLPNETRLRLAIDTLRERIRHGGDADAYGLTLGYIGHQLGDAALVKEGLTTVTGSRENDLLRQLLSGVWLGAPLPAEPAAEDSPK